VRLREGFVGAWDALREDHPDRRLFVVADRKVLVRQPMALAGLSPREREAVVQVDGGERIKNLRHLDALVDRALQARVDRRCLVVALGGGTVGDLVGYFAASYMRGLDWCPLGTTVIAMADSAVGGKTGVNAHGLKNLIGSFHQPVGVYGALEAIASLGRRHRVGGLAEVLKCGIIADAKLYELLEAEAEALAPHNHELWGEVLMRSIRVKASVVEEDPTERGRREVLNFGHTLGHAVEATTRPRLHHGEAVGLGMIGALRISQSRQLAPPGTTSRVTELIGRLGLPRAVPGIDPESALVAVGYDKKVWDRKVRMVLTEGIGSATVGHTVEWSELSQALQSLRS
jgi:3-dehydroquinate synthase